MKHLELFESWHSGTVCSHCKGAGYIGPSKKESMKNIIKNSTEEHFLEFLDDEDFIKNAADVFKEQGVFSVRTANMLVALNLTHAEMQDIIKTTEDRIHDLEEVSKMDVHMKGREKEIRKIEGIVKNKSQILAALRR